MTLRILICPSSDNPFTPSDPSYALQWGNGGVTNYQYVAGISTTIPATRPRRGTFRSGWRTGDRFRRRAA
jgi:hypothetical protein